VSYQGSVVERFPRLQGQGAARIDYRHIIHARVRKPGAFRRYPFREALFPRLTFRRAYDALVERSERWADLAYRRILHLAAPTLESVGESVLSPRLEEGEVPTYEAVKGASPPGRLQSPLWCRCRRWTSRSMTRSSWLGRWAQEYRGLGAAPEGLSAALVPGSLRGARRAGGPGRLEPWALSR
jgi:hypothetical protein